MILYVDETENEEFFIVTGLLMPSKEDTDLAYKKFRKNIDRLNVPIKEKPTLFIEFKSTQIDRKYKKIKFKMLESINEVDNTIIYSAYYKKEKSFNQEQKEKVYIKNLIKIVNTIDEDIDIIFDKFNKKDFEKKIILSILNFDNVKSIEPKDSKNISGLQFVDNICSVLRLHESNTDKYNYYECIEKNVIKV